MIYSIDGYWKDDKTEFSEFLVTEFDEHPEGYEDDEIFFYGLHEENLKQAIKNRENTELEFVITNYENI